MSDGGEQEDKKILLWSGPREEVREEGASAFRISATLPAHGDYSKGGRLSAASQDFPRMANEYVGSVGEVMEVRLRWFDVCLGTNTHTMGFHSYLEMAALSLYFLNLLPLPYLDGMELFRCLRVWTRESREGGGVGEADRERVV